MGKCRAGWESAHIWEARLHPFWVSYLRISTQQRWPPDTAYPSVGSKAGRSLLNGKQACCSKAASDFKNQRDYTHLYKQK